MDGLNYHSKQGGNKSFFQGIIIVIYLDKYLSIIVGIYRRYCPNGYLVLVFTYNLLRKNIKLVYLLGIAGIK